jgi:hypothetical protein
LDRFFVVPIPTTFLSELTGMHWNPNDEFLHPDKINRLMKADLHYQLSVMAHNGSEMNDDPLRCFANEGQFD